LFLDFFIFKKFEKTKTGNDNSEDDDSEDDDPDDDPNDDHIGLMLMLNTDDSQDDGLNGVIPCHG